MMSLPSYRNDPGKKVDDFVINTSRHTPLGRSDVNSSFFHSNCECGSQRDSKNYLMCSEYGMCAIQHLSYIFTLYHV